MGAVAAMGQVLLQLGFSDLPQDLTVSRRGREPPALLPYQQGAARIPAVH